MNPVTISNLKMILFVAALTCIISGSLFVLSDFMKDHYLKEYEKYNISTCEEIELRPSDFKPVDASIDEKKQLCYEYYLNYHENNKTAFKSFLGNAQFYLSFVLPLMIAIFIVYTFWEDKKTFKEVDQ